MANKACPKCKNPMQKLDGKKLPSGMVGRKYWMCLPCKWVKLIERRERKPKKGE